MHGENGRVVERAVAELPPAETLLSFIGATALIGNTPPSHEGPSLSEDEAKVLILASFGGTVDQVAAYLGTDNSTIGELRDSVIGKFDAKNMAGAVNKAILGGVLPVEVNPEPVTQVVKSAPRSMKVLTMFADGDSNAEIAEAFGKKTGTLDKNINRPLFKRLRANGRTHSVRRAYELGIFTLPEADATNSTAQQAQAE